MNRLDMYLNEMSSLLPKAQRNDILAEIEEELRMQFDDRTEEIGRDLTEDEQQEILTRFGAPIMVAGRYQKPAGTLTFGEGVLIGPELFPFYQKSLKFFLAAAVIVVSIVYVGMGISDLSKWDGYIKTLLFHVVVQFTIQTGVWVALQKSYEKNPDKWKPKAKVERVSRLDSFFQLALNAAFLPAVQYFLGNAGNPTHAVMLTEPWKNIYIPAMLMGIVSIAQAVATLIKPELVRMKQTVQLAVGAMGVVLCGYLLTAGPLVRINEIAGGTLEKRTYGSETINAGIYFGVAVTGLILIATLVDARKFIVSPSPR